MAAATVAWKNGAPSSAGFRGSVFTITIMSLSAILPRPLRGVPGDKRLVSGRPIIGPPSRGQALFQDPIAQILAERCAHFGVLESVLEIGLQVAQLAAAVEALPFELIGEHVLLVHQRRDGIGQLDLA